MNLELKNFSVEEVVEMTKDVPYVDAQKLPRKIITNEERNKLGLENGVGFSRGAQSIEVSIVPGKILYTQHKDYPESLVNFLSILQQVSEFEQDFDQKIEGLTNMELIEQIKAGKWKTFKGHFFPLLCSVDEYGITYYDFSKKDLIINELGNLFSNVSDNGLRSDIAELVRFIAPMKEGEFVYFWGD